MKLGLRQRVAFWCAALVVVSGVVVVLLVVVLSGRFLHERARQADQATREAGAAAAPAQPRPGPLGQGQLGQGPGQVPGQVPGPTAQDVARRAAADATFRDVRNVGLLAVLGLTVAAIATSWVLAGRIIRPVKTVTDTARSITADSRLDRRIAYDGAPDELHELADSFDGMLDRLEAVFDAQRSFVSNTSHELRTPIAVMQAEVDVALDDPNGDEATMRSALKAVRDELRSTTGLVGAMLDLARAEAITDPATVDLSLVADAAVQALAPAWAAEHRVVTSFAEARVSGDPVLLSQLVANLVRNAEKYNRPGGLLSVATATVGGRAQVVVENDGGLVDPAVVASLFSRFVRRSEAGEGYGLGLAIVHAIVETHGGTVSAVARPDGGLRVEVLLPAAPSPA